MTTATASPSNECATLDVNGVAKLLGVSRLTVYRHLDRLPTPVRMGRRVFWFRDELLAHLRDRKGEKS